MKVIGIRLRSIWLTGIYKPALLVGVLGMLFACILLGDLSAKFFNSSTILDKVISAAVACAFLELISYIADKLTVDNMNTKIEADLKWAIRIGKKYPQYRSLCKELNPMLTDEMMWKYRSKKKSRLRR